MRPADVRRLARRALARPHAVFVRVYGRARRRQPSLTTGPPTRLLRSLDAQLLVGIGLQHVRGGRLGDAVAAFERAQTLAPRNEQARRFGKQVAGDLRVLSGAWQPPELDMTRVDPVKGRVLHVVHKSLPYSQSGYTLRTRSIVLAQRDQGLQPHVITDVGFPPPGSTPSPVPSLELVDGVPHHRLAGDGQPPPDQRLDRRVRVGAGVLREVRPALVHAASDLFNAQVALAWGRHFGLPVVYEVRGFWADTWLARGRGPLAGESDVYVGRRQRERDCMLAADAIVTLGEAMKAEIVDQGVDDGAVVVVPNAVDVERFLPGDRDLALAARLGVGPDDVTVGHVTSMTHYEGIDLLLEAVARLARAGRRVKAVLVGDGTERRALEARARRLGLGSRVVFTGWVPYTEVADYYRLIDVFVVPRVAARVCEMVTPLKPYEAMATERAMVVSDVAALREIVEDGQTGLVFPAGRADRLADAIDALVASHDERRRLGRNARAWVSQHRTWATNGARYLELYRRLGAV